jgi:hypothetical protein
MAVALVGLYNWLRFDSALDNGIAHHAMHPFFREAYESHGAFSLYYLPTNFFYQYISYPLPLRSTSLQGGSLVLLSPLFVAAFWAIRDKRRSSVGYLALSVALVSAPILLLMGTGWVQFGPRYTLDFTVPLLLLVAIGSRWWPTSLMAFLTVLSILQYLLGAMILMTLI